jgi:hypothetical protein
VWLIILALVAVPVLMETIHIADSTEPPQMVFLVVLVVVGLAIAAVGLVSRRH